MKLAYHCKDHWPPLAWLAEWSPDDDRVDVAHGTLVETHPSWFGEIVWDGQFEAGDFDQTDVVFGSGARLRGGRLAFVPSASTLDRLHSLVLGNRWWVSNSLVCLMARLDAAVDVAYGRYGDDFRTITWGIDRYRDGLSTSAGRVRLTYFHNLVAEGVTLGRQAKPSACRDFSTFARYRGFLEQMLCRLANNARSSSRNQPFDLLATVSTGFDSPTVAALALKAGLRHTLSFDRARGGDEDNGAEIARCLGLDPIVVSREAWKASRFPEVPFLAGDAKGEDVYFHGAESCLAGKLLLTGFGANRVWKRGKQPSADFRRGDQSGLSLTEYRLWHGFVHCPVAAIGGRQTTDLYALLDSAEMAPWRAGKAYNKPICRRILQEAGVPSELYGVGKKAASILLFQRHSFLTPDSRSDFESWRRRHVFGRPAFRARVAWTSDHLVLSLAQVAVRGLQAAAARISRYVPLPWLKRLASSSRLTSFANYEPLFRYLFPWAMQRAIVRYKIAPQTMADRGIYDQLDIQGRGSELASQFQRGPIK